MEDKLKRELGANLYEALRTGQVIDSLTDKYPDITIDDAYAIQKYMLNHRLDSGETVVGKKIGVTSQVVMDMLGVDQPDFGWLTDAMIFNQGDDIPISQLIQPKAEGEIAFLLNKTLQGPGVTVADVLVATDGVMACFEIVDSRIRDWKIKIQDTVADNASCGFFVLGDKIADIKDLDLKTCGMVLEKNGRIAATGVGAAALGHPANAVAWLANTLGNYGIALEAGEVVLSGSLGAMVPVVANDYLSMSIEGIGSCSVRFT